MAKPLTEFEQGKRTGRSQALDQIDILIKNTLADANLPEGKKDLVRAEQSTFQQLEKLVTFLCDRVDSLEWMLNKKEIELKGKEEKV